MKRKYGLLIIAIVTIIYGIDVYAVSYFPEKLQLKRYYDYNKSSDYSGITVYPDRIVNKTYEAKVGNETISGRAFCTEWGYKVPWYYLGCESEPWVKNNDTENEIVSASIGHFIYDLRGENGISERDYFYGEMAINDFLYQHYHEDVNNIRNSSNHAVFHEPNLSISETYRKKIEDYYNKYSSKESTIIIKNVKVNNVVIGTQNTSINKSQSSNYQLKVLLNCSDKNCDDATVNNISVGDENHKNSINYNVDKNNDGTALITADISNNINESLGVNNYIEISINNTAKTYKSKRYACGKEYTTKYQSIVPNMLMEGTYNLSPVEWNGVFNINDTSKPCEQQITDNPVSNAELYINHSGNNDYGEKLLDINDTSCGHISNNPGKIDCDKTDISYSWIDNNLEIESGKFNAYCSARFSFENNAVKDKYTKKGGKIYKVDNGVIGEATVVYDCNVPILYNNPKVAEKEIDSSLITPKLKMKVGNNEITINGSITKIENYNDSNLCRKSNGNVLCNNYTNDVKKGFGWGFVAKVQYKYPDSMNGFTVPNDAEVSNNNKSHIDFDLTDTVFKNVSFGENGRNTECKYGVVNGDVEYLYRTINYDKPFVKYYGEERDTGFNWCETGDEEAEANKEICQLLGDVNGNGNLDDEDVVLIQKIQAAGGSGAVDANNFQGMKISLNCADVDSNGNVDTNDATLVQQMIASLYGESASEGITVSYEDKTSDADNNNGCGANNFRIQKYIKQRPNANGKYMTANNVEKSVDGPLYSIKLEPSDIKNIREYNKNQGGYSSSSSSINEFINTYIKENNIGGLCKSSVTNNGICDLDNVWKKGD